MPKIHNDITQYVRSCDRCQTPKRSSANTRAPLTNMPQVSKFERWHVDILGPIAKTKDIGISYFVLIHIVDGQRLFHKQTWILRKLLQNFTKKYFAVIDLQKYLCKTVDKIFSPILFRLSVKFSR